MQLMRECSKELTERPGKQTTGAIAMDLQDCRLRTSRDPGSGLAVLPTCPLLQYDPNSSANVHATHFNCSNHDHSTK